MPNASNALKIEVRPAEARDATVIARLAGELGYPSTAEQVRERLAAMEEDPHQATFVAAVTGDEVIGWIHLGEVHSIAGEPRAKSSILLWIRVPAALGLAVCWPNEANDGRANGDLPSSACVPTSSVSARTRFICDSDTPL